jgi:hypothetical protein
MNHTLRKYVVTITLIIKIGHGKRKNVIVTYFSSVSWIGLWANIIASKKLLLIIVALHEKILCKFKWNI